MRRIATLAVTTGLAVTCLGALATTADAAAGGTWKTKDGYSSVSANGKWARSSSSVKVTGAIYDHKKNGYAPAVQFLAREKGKRDHYSGMVVLYRLANGKRVPFDAAKGGGHVGTVFSSTNTDRLYVRECGYNIKTPKKSACSNTWKRIYKVR